jgi:uncharacterized RDD family membrane protein YckC
MRSYTDELTPQPPLVTAVLAGADFGIRFLARGIDIILGILLGVVSGFFAGILIAILSSLGRVRSDWVEVVGQTNYWTYVFGILGGLLYHFFAESIGGTTVGKLICGLNVVQLDGRPCTLVGALKRSVAYLIDALFFGYIAYESMQKSALRQRHGDIWGKTVVVKKTVFLPTPARAIWRVVAGCMVGSAALMVAQVTHLLIAVS